MRGIPEDKALSIIEDLHAFGTADGAKRLRDAIVDLKEPLRSVDSLPHEQYLRVLALLKDDHELTPVEIRHDGSIIMCDISGDIVPKDDIKGWIPMPEVDHD